MFWNRNWRLFVSQLIREIIFHRSAWTSPGSSYMRSWSAFLLDNSRYSTFCNWYTITFTGYLLRISRISANLPCMPRRERHLPPLSKHYPPMNFARFHSKTWTVVPFMAYELHGKPAWTKHVLMISCLCEKKSLIPCPAHNCVRGWVKSGALNCWRCYSTLSEVCWLHISVTSRTAGWQFRKYLSSHTTNSWRTALVDYMTWTVA